MDQNDLHFDGVADCSIPTRTADQRPSPAILELVNRARIYLQMRRVTRLPRGIPGNSRRCVLSRGLGAEFLLDDQDRPFTLLQEYRRACKLAAAWQVEKPSALWNGWAVRLPSDLNTFIHNFDAHQYPQLISRRAHNSTEHNLKVGTAKQCDVRRPRSSSSAISAAVPTPLAKHTLSEMWVPAIDS